MNDETRQPDPQGDYEDRFNELHKVHSLFLYYELRKSLGESEAEDAAQEVWLRAYIGMASLREPKKFRSWLVSIALNYATSHFRKNGQPLLSLDELDNTDGEPTTDPWLHFIHDADLERILQPLTDDHRELVVMHYIEGFELKEIAEIKGLKEGAIRAWLFRFKKDLIKFLKRYLELE